MPIYWHSCQFTGISRVTVSKATCTGRAYEQKNEKKKLVLDVSYFVRVDLQLLDACVCSKMKTKGELLQGL